MKAWQQFESSFPGWVIRNRWLVILLSIALIGLAASGARHLEITNSYRNYFGPEDPHRLAFDKVENTYTKEDNLLIIVAPRDGRVFTRETLAAVADITEKSWQIPFSTRVDSVTNYQHSVAEQDDLAVGDLVKDPGTLDDQALAYAESVALAEPLLARRLISESAHVTGINITIQVPGIHETEEFPAAVLFTRELVRKAGEDYPNIDFYISGLGAMHYAFTEAAFGDMAFLIPASFGLMLVLLAILAGGIKGTIATLFVIAFSVAGAMGMAGFLGYKITPTMAPAPNVILTVAVANCVHILISYFHGLEQDETQFEAIIESLRINLHPVSLASLTTALGFLTLNFSDAPPFQQMGNVIAIGVVFSFFLSITFLPAILAILPQAKIKQSRFRLIRTERIADFTVTHRRGLLWGMSAAIILLVAQLPRNEVNDMFIEFFDESLTFRRHTDFLLDNLTGIYTIQYSIESGSPGGINEPAYLKKLDEFANWWRAQPGVVHVNTLTDTMKRLNKNMHGDDAQAYRLPANRELAAQYLLLYEMSLPYGLDLNNQVNVDKSATRLVITLEPLNINETIDLANRGEAWLAENSSSVTTHHGTGMVMMFSHLTIKNTTSMLGGTGVAIILIAGVLILALRSLKLGLLSLIPNLAPIAVGFGVWGIFNGSVGIGLSSVGSMTLGIVVDNTVHFMSKYLRARRERGYDSHAAVKYAINTVGRALIVTAIVLVAGFSVLAMSNFQLNSVMGLLTAIVIGFALIGVFFLLPPLLMAIEDRKEDATIAPA